MPQKDEWPQMFYAAGGKQEVFAKAEDVPAGFYHTVAEAEAGKTAKAASPTPMPTPTASDAQGEIDAAGWPFDPALHAATKTKTTAGLWRMKVGVTRPAPKTLDL